MSWHPFELGKLYPLAEVLAVCERRLTDGAVLALEEKRRLVELMRSHGPNEMVWSPASTGWGASPFNPNNWRANDGAPILPPGQAVPELPE
jgi:hypothetical protein